VTNLAYVDNRRAKKNGITELVFTQDSSEQLSLLLPMIAFLNQQDRTRWITWVAPEQFINRELLEAYGIDTRFIRIVRYPQQHSLDKQTLLWLTWEALVAGNSHTVIATPGKLTGRELMQLEGAATHGNCHGFLLRTR
jgi:cell division inhibitor SulA